MIGQDGCYAVSSARSRPVRLLCESRDRTPYAAGRGGGDRARSRGLQAGPPTPLRWPDGLQGHDSDAAESVDQALTGEGGSVDRCRGPAVDWSALDRELSGRLLRPTTAATRPPSAPSIRVATISDRWL
jgi:hypothetical protein